MAATEGEGEGTANNQGKERLEVPGTGIRVSLVRLSLRFENSTVWWVQMDAFWRNSSREPA